MTFFWQNSTFGNPRKTKREPLGYSLVNDDGWIAVQSVSANDYGCVSTVRWRSSARVSGSVIQDELPIPLPGDSVDATSYGGKTRWKVYPGGRLRRHWELETPDQGRVVSRVIAEKVDEKVQARRTRVLEQMIEHKGRTVRKFDLSKGRATKWIVASFRRWAELVTKRGTGTAEEDAFWEGLYDEADYEVVNQLYNDLGVDREWGRVNPGDVVVFRKGKKVLAVVGRVPRVNWCEPMPDYVWVT